MLTELFQEMFTKTLNWHLTQIYFMIVIACNMLDLINRYPCSYLTVLDFIHESGTFIRFGKKKSTFRFPVQLSCMNISHKPFNKTSSLKTEVLVQNMEVASMNLKASRQNKHVVGSTEMRCCHTIK